MGNMERLAQEDGLSALVAGKTVWRLYRRAGQELLIEFTDGTQLTIDAARAEIDLAAPPRQGERPALAW